MKYEEMTKYQQSKMYLQECPICSGKFTKFDDVQELKMRYGRSIMHFYFHSKCLLGLKVPSQLEREEEYEEATV